MSHLLTADNMPGFQWNMNTYGGRSHIYLLQLCVWLILAYWHPWRPSTITGVIKRTAFVYLLCSNQYVSNLYILDRNPRLSSSTIGVTYSDYILLLFVCVNCPLTSKTGVCWNLPESTPARIPLIKSSHKWTQILSIIPNYKIGIWLCIQPRIDLNSQSNFYDVLTLDHTSTCPTQSNKQHTWNTFYI